MEPDKRFEYVEFTTVKEDWNRYKLEDGTIIEMKLIVLRVLKYPDDVDEFGIPHYIVRSHNVVNPILKK